MTIDFGLLRRSNLNFLPIRSCEISVKVFDDLSGQFRLLVKAVPVSSTWSSVWRVNRIIIHPWHFPFYFWTFNQAVGERRLRFKCPLLVFLNIRLLLLLLVFPVFVSTIQTAFFALSFIEFDFISLSISNCLRQTNDHFYCLDFSNANIFAACSSAFLFQRCAFRRYRHIEIKRENLFRSPIQNAPNSKLNHITAITFARAHFVPTIKRHSNKLSL